MRVTLDIPAEAHRQIKTLAAFNGMTMKDFIVSRALSTDSVEEKKGANKSQGSDETEYLLSSPVNAARLQSALQSAPNTRVGFNSVEELRNALGV
jgi:hypothetical protein